MNKLTITPKNQTRVIQNQRLVWDISSAMLALSMICAAFVSGNNRVKGYLPDYEWRREVRIEAPVQLSEGFLAQFPLQIVVQDEALRHQDMGGDVKDMGGLDLAFSSADGATVLSHHLVNYQPQEGKLKVWVLMDTFYLNQPTSLFLYYGNEKLVQNSTAETVGVSQPKVFKAAHTRGLSHPAIQDSLRTKVERAYQRPSQDLIQLGKAEPLRKGKGVIYAHLKGIYKPEPKTININWTTRFESEGERFWVERSADGQAFDVIGLVKGHGFSLVEQPYMMIDHRPLMGANYYRIRQINEDASYSFSPTWVVNPLSISQWEVAAISPTTKL